MVVDDEDYTGRSATVVGWGRLAERKKTSDTLQKVTVPIISQEECKTQGYPASKISDQMICAGYPLGEKDACQVGFVMYSFIEFIAYGSSSLE